MQPSAVVLPKIFSVVLLLCLAVAGCGTTCVSGFWDGNKSGVGVSNLSCPFTTATGTVVGQMSATSSPASSSAVVSSPRSIQHIFVTLRAIEARPGIRADAASSVWQELAPDLAAHPVQLDLMAGNRDSPLAGLPASLNFTATVPADEYRQLRLRLVPSHPSADETTPESNACSGAGWNCIVFADRSVRPLEFGSAAPEFQIAIGYGASNLLRVLPDEVIHLSIEFDAARSAFLASDPAIRIVPVFRVASRSSTLEAN